MLHLQNSDALLLELASTVKLWCFVVGLFLEKCNILVKRDPILNQKRLYTYTLGVDWVGKYEWIDLTKRQCIPLQLSSSWFASSCRHLIWTHAPVRPQRATSPPASSPTASATSPCPSLRATPGYSTPPSSTSGSRSRTSPGLPLLSSRSRGMTSGEPSCAIRVRSGGHRSFVWN